MPLKAQLISLKTAPGRAPQPTASLEAVVHEIPTVSFPTRNYEKMMGSQWAQKPNPSR